MVKLYDKVMLFLIYLIKRSIICIMYLTVHVWLPDLYVWIVHVWKILNLLFIWILKLKYTKSNMCYYFLFHLRSILLFCQKVTSMLVFSLTKIFHTFVCLTMLCPTCVFFHLTAVRLSSLCFSSHWPPGVVLSLLSF